MESPLDRNFLVRCMLAVSLALIVVLASTLRAAEPGRTERVGQPAPMPQQAEARQARMSGRCMPQGTTVTVRSGCGKDTAAGREAAGNRAGRAAPGATILENI